MSLPWPMTTNSSAISAISDNKWLLTKTVRPSFAKSRRRSRIHRMPSGSRPFTGSSRIRTSGSPSNTDEIPKRCFIPKEYFPTRRRDTSLSPTCSSTASTRVLLMPVLAANHMRWLRALRPLCAFPASSSVPTRCNGCVNLLYATPLNVADPPWA